MPGVWDRMKDQIRAEELLVGAVYAMKSNPREALGDERERILETQKAIAKGALGEAPRKLSVDQIKAALDRSRRRDRGETIL